MRSGWVVVLLLVFGVSGQTVARPYADLVFDETIKHLTQQDAPPATYHVFTQRVPATGATIVTFLDLLSGETVEVETFGDRHQVIGGAVAYWDTRQARVMATTPDGTVVPHPVIEAEPGARRVDWVVSDDGKLLAWTSVVTDAAGDLTTTTVIAGTDGSDRRVLLVDGPRSDGLRAFPVAFSPDGMTLYMDYQPDGVGERLTIPQYVGLFAVALDAGVPEFLPGEPGNFTGAGFGAGFFLRLQLPTTRQGFDLRVLNLTTGFETTIPALTLRGLTQGGDFLVAPDGRRAVYALTQTAGIDAPEPSVQTVFVLVDLVAMTQAELTPPITSFVRPVAWTEDDSAVLFVSPDVDGTWKIRLSDGALEQIASQTYVGMLATVP